MPSLLSTDLPTQKIGQSEAPGLRVYPSLTES